MMNHRLSIPLLLAAVLFGLLSGCAQAPKQPERPKQTPAQIQQLAAAAAFEASGDFTAAAAVYEQLAATVPSPQRDEWLLRAADARLQGGDIAGAEAVLGRVQRKLLPARERLLARLLAAEVLLAWHRPGGALGLLERPPYPNAPTELRVRFLRDRAQGLRLSGDLLGSARELGELDLLVVKRIDRLKNQLQLLRTLTTLPDGTLEGSRPTTPGILGGWMDLARILKIYRGSREDGEILLGQWRENNPNHPALPDLLKHYLAGMELTTFRRIAVLLPAGGRFAAAASAVRDGLLAAYYAAPADQRPELVFYDSSNPADIWPLLQQAAAEGADAAIGPLQKEAVQQLVRAGELEIPVLTLNRVPLGISPPGNLFQFGLAPEDEAAQAADKAWADGAVTALALVPEGDWGERLLHSFRERWESLGGELTGYRTYDPEQNDFTESIRGLLRQSQTRGAGALFLAANWTKARQLWPQLQFHTPADLPVYTTSHIYTGRFTHPQDLDLVGLTFPDIPWILAPEGRGAITPERLPPELANNRGALARLFALGIDSYRLLANLQRMRDFPASSLVGATGDLYLDGLNQVHRRLVWARMTSGGPRTLGFTPDPHRPPQFTDADATVPAPAMESPAATAPHGQTR
jgi:outer membrane PBP1 activator LpoA protein